MAISPIMHTMDRRRASTERETTSRKWKVFEQNTYFWNDDDGTMRVAPVLY